MSEVLIASLNQRVTELTQQVANLNSALKQERGQRKQARTELEQAQAAAKVDLDKALKQVSALEAERDAFKSKAEAAPSEQSARIADLEGQLALRDHRDAFRDAATGAGVRSAAVADLYQLSGLKPGDAPAKPEDFAAWLATAKEARSWAFDVPPAAGPTPAHPATNGSTQGPVTVPATPAPPGSGRGAPDTTPAKVQYRMKDVQVPGWEHTNPALRTALAKGYAECIAD